MQFRKESFINASPKTVFDFHELPDAFERLIPPWENARVIQKADITKIGSQAIIEMKVLGIFPVRWVAEHTRYEPPHLFEDVQVSGPFKTWRHLHTIEPSGNGTLLRDEIDFQPPLWFLGKLASPIAIFPKLEKMFEFRHKITKDFCESTNYETIMLTHIVCWKYKPETSEDQKIDHLEKLKNLKTLIPKILSFEVGSDILHLERSFDTGLVATYEDQAALDFYTDHPEHLKVAALGKEIAEKVVSVDFLN